MRVLHTIFYTTFFWAMAGLYVLFFCGVQVTVPTTQAEAVSYQTAQAQDIFNAVEKPHKGRK